MEEGWHEGKVGCGLELGPGKAGEVETRPMGYGAADGGGGVLDRWMGVDGGGGSYGGAWLGLGVGGIGRRGGRVGGEDEVEEVGGGGRDSRIGSSQVIGDLRHPLVGSGDPERGGRMDREAVREVFLPRREDCLEYL